jgi:hypothetical protein
VVEAANRREAIVRKRLGRRWTVGLVIALAALVVVPLAFAGAINTTTDPGQTVNGKTTEVCINGPDPSVNCNIYQQKEDVFLSGSPVQASLGSGTYYFAVVSPGGQPDPNPGAPDLLSSDDGIQREFSLDNAGAITNLGDHLLDSNKLSVFPYNDTPNHGGVYILAVCKISSSQNTAAITLPTVDPKDCKYDAFKVKESSAPGASGPTILKDAAGSYTNTYAWDIEKSADKTLVRQTGGTASFTYTVHVTHDGGTISDVTVSGSITVFNPNDGSMVADVTDALSGNTVCSVTGGSGATLAPGDNSFDYSCDLGDTLPASSIDNVATVTWADQTIVPDGFLAGGSADFTFSGVSFTGTDADKCTTVTDPVPSGGTSNDNPFPKTVCVGDTGDGGAGTDASDGFTFTYHVSYNVGVNCTNYTNTATESTDGNYASVTVTVCGPSNNSALTIGFWKNNGLQLLQSYACPPGGKTSLANYLKGLGAGFGPFMDAAGCDLRTYVTNILKGASATNMNVMLKAQMLATALDVYFSDPGLGYTTTAVGKTKPPSTFLTHGPLGSFNMDLTAICPMIDNTTAGTATCKNNTPSTNGVTSGAFPASPHQVQWILNFAATIDVSPWTNGAYSGSNNWYAGNRTLEEVLKNTFDQINNNDAFAG